MSWVAQGKVSKAIERATAENNKVAEEARRAGIEAERETAGLKKVTIQQAHTFIDNKLNAATTVTQVKEAVRDILKRMVPYILD